MAQGEGGVTEGRAYCRKCLIIWGRVDRGSRREYDLDTVPLSHTIISCLGCFVW